MHSENEVAHEVLRAIRKIVRRIAEHSKQLSREVGLTVPQLMCLKAVGELEHTNDEVTMAMVAHQVHLSAATVSRIIERMVKTGLLERERRSKDRRRVCLSLTETGGSRLASLPAPLQESFVVRFHALPRSERHAILAALYKLTELMDAADLDAAPILAPGAEMKVTPAD